MPMKITKLKYDSVCKDCGAQLAAGTEHRAYTTQSGKLIFYCRDPKQHLNQTMEVQKQPQASFSRPSIQKAEELTIKQSSKEQLLKEASNLLHEIRLMVDNEWKDSPMDYSLYQPTIAAIFTSISMRTETWERYKLWGEKKW